MREKSGAGFRACDRICAGAGGEDKGMSRFGFEEMQEIQRELQEKYQERWGGLSPEKGIQKLLWMFSEAGEVADAIKKTSTEDLLADTPQRRHFIEEMCDVMMYFNDVLLCYSITPEELSEVAPILKPDQVDEVFEKLEVSDLKEIEDLLPFIGGSVVDNILLKAAESGDGRDLDIVAPFAGKDALGKAAVKLYQRFGMRGIEELIPFLSGEQREDIAELEYARNGLRMAGVEDEIFDLLDGFTDFERLGRSMMEEDGVQATSFGSIKRLSAPFPQQPEMGQTMY